MAYKDKEKEKEHKRQYYEANRENVLEQRRQYRETNREKIADYMQQYYNTPLGRAKIMVGHFKQSDKKCNRGECTIDEQWIVNNIFTSKCHYCGETDWKQLGCDRIDNSLPHTPENVVCSCWDCNNKRGTMPFDEFVQRLKSGETLLKKNCPNLSKPVMALDEDRNIICEFPSTNEAGRNGFDHSNVSAACRGCYLREGNHKYKGLNWYYK